MSLENTNQLNQSDVLKEGFSNDHNEPQKEDSRPGTIQRSMQSFLVTDEKEKVSPVDTR